MSIIQATVSFVKHELQFAEGGHDWWHAYRVWKLSKVIGEKEGADGLVCELAALLHDLEDHKFHASPAGRAGEFLKMQGVDQETIIRVEEVISSISFSYELQGLHKPKSPELMVVQDADRLDAMGAIGIARAFNFGGFKNRIMFDPAISPVHQITSEQYSKGHSPTINHFYEKLLLLKDRMNTTTGRTMAQQRHVFMEQYLEEFFKEWEGNI